MDMEKDGAYKRPLKIRKIETVGEGRIILELKKKRKMAGPLA